MNTHNVQKLTKISLKSSSYLQKLTKISLKSSSYLRLWTINLSRWQAIIIQTPNKILFDKAMTVWVKISADDILKYFLIFSEPWQCLFPGKKKYWNYHQMSSAEYSQKVVMVKDKPYLCMREMGLILKVIKIFQAHGSKLQIWLTFFFVYNHVFFQCYRVVICSYELAH